jgi:heme/copper-type cytochrome/quinol oxidase subunit 2
MNLMDKIEEIKQKPERERIFYVWVMVAICMIFIVLVWFFSFKNTFRKENKMKNDFNMAENLEEIKSDTDKETNINDSNAKNSFKGDNN